jgi:lambda family phage portal protein
MREIKIGRSSVKVAWNALDRVIESIAPIWAGRRLQARTGHALASAGSYNGASRGRASLAGWNPLAGDADDASLLDLPTLRERSQDLDRNAPLAGGAVNTLVTNVVGTGLSVEPQIDHKRLGLTEEEAAAAQDALREEFALWADSPDCDVERVQNFYELQDLALRTWMLSGDAFAVLADVQRPNKPLPLAIQIIEGELCSNPDRKADTPTLVAGIERDQNKAAVAYHFASANPSRYSTRSRTLTWSRVPAYGAGSGRRLVLHLIDRKRSGQTRGIPFLAPIIEPLKQLERYTEAELQAAVISALFTVFIKSEGQTTIEPSALAAQGSGSGSGGSWDGRLGNGLVVDLGPKESIETANPGRPNAQFDPFVMSIIRQIGMLLQIPFEVLLKHYASSYSASKAAMNDAWRFFRVRRDRLASRFCQPIYEAVIAQAVARRRIIAPGFFSDPAIRRAWCRAKWVGDGPGSLDPLKEALAARERVDLTISTLTDESILHDGGNWEAKVRQRGREEALRLANQLGNTTPQSGAAQADAPDTQDNQSNPTNNDPRAAAIARAYRAAALAE